MATVFVAMVFVVCVVGLLIVTSFERGIFEIGKKVINRLKGRTMEKPADGF